MTTTTERIGDQRPRLAVIDSLAITKALDPYLSLTSLAPYADVSVRWLRDRLTDPRHPLPHYRIGGKVLVRRSEFDAWITAYRRAGRPDVDAIVDEVLRDVTR